MINQQNDDLIFLTSEKNEKLSYGEFKIFNEKNNKAPNSIKKPLLIHPFNFHFGHFKRDHNES